MDTIFVVFALPMLRPGDRDFLAAYTTQTAAQKFVDSQQASVRQNLRVVEIKLNEHPPSEDFWTIPE